MILQLRTRLLEVEPEIWRRLLVRDRATLHDLHRVIQIAMGWWDYHLYAFEVGGRRFEEPSDDYFLDEALPKDATGTTLKSLGLKKGASFIYRYDFGDDWTMELLLERRRQERRGSTLPWVLEGERAGPPEDCGGVYGFAEALEVLGWRDEVLGDIPRDSSLAEKLVGPDFDGHLDLDSDERERRQRLSWLDDYDPARFDVRAVNQFLMLSVGWGALSG